MHLFIIKQNKWRSGYSYHIFECNKEKYYKIFKADECTYYIFTLPSNSNIHAIEKKIAIVFFLFYIGLNAICYASSVYRRFIPTPSISINSAYSFMCIFVHVHIRSCAYSFMCIFVHVHIRSCAYLFMCIFFLGSYYKELQVYILCLDCNSKVKLLVP